MKKNPPLANVAPSPGLCPAPMFFFCFYLIKPHKTIIALLIPCYCLQFLTSFHERSTCSASSSRWVGIGRGGGTPVKPVYSVTGSSTAVLTVLRTVPVSRCATAKAAGGGSGGFLLRCFNTPVKANSVGHDSVNSRWP